VTTASVRRDVGTICVRISHACPQWWQVDDRLRDAVKRLCPGLIFVYQDARCLLIPVGIEGRLREALAEDAPWLRIDRAR
jgi:hypothetical protein